MAKKQPRDLSGLIDLKEQKERKVQSAPTQEADSLAERKPATFRIRPKAKKQFGILAKELDMTEQDLIAEAMNLIFEKHGKEPIA